ncbi:oxaloacetate decarboxylase [Dehalobacter sp. DCM]|uniref:isocitrate lyase/PEP mutase family protein n=1 Tax=Dehalobacter sp. DCM TaxID=2907827 RepID=UPI003081BA4F|nr:oxaloacetate decarboxylase [Dehalobacter sp. DCM]
MLKNPGKALRDLLQAPGIIMSPGAYDGISAQVSEQAGFPILYLSGAGASTSRIGEADIGLTTMTEIVDSARAIAMKANIPLMCDADTGYGNALNVIRTVHEMEMAGIAAIQLEDQVAPKRCGHLSGKDCIPAQEFVQKIKAAVKERFYEDTVIVARTDARAVYNLDAAMERGKMVMDAGADVLFIEAPQTLDEIELIGKTFGSQIPLLSNQVIGGKTPKLTAKEAEQLGYKIIIYPDVLCFGASVFLRRIADRILQVGHSWDAIPDTSDSRELFNTMGMQAWRELEHKYKD